MEKQTGIELGRQLDEKPVRVLSNVLALVGQKLDKHHTKVEDGVKWPAPGSEDTELGVLMEPEVRHGEAEVYARVQA
jgi:hypothetical protein